MFFKLENIFPIRDLKGKRRKEKRRKRKKREHGVGGRRRRMTRRKRMRRRRRRKGRRTGGRGNLTSVAKSLLHLERQYLCAVLLAVPVKPTQ